MEHLETLKTLGTEVAYAAGSIVYLECDYSDHLYIVLAGQVRLYRYDGKGNEITLPLPDAGDILGELPVDEGDRPRYRESCETESASTLLRIDAQRLCRHAHKEIGVANYLIAALSRRGRTLSRYTSITVASSQSEKVARFIYDHESLFRTQPIARIATMLNIPPESLSRTLRRFRQQGILSTQKGIHEVLDREALREYFDFAYFGG
jgi:CRP/FNR family transcriptional regulator